MTVDEARLVLGALDTLGVALADEDHCWTEGERTIFEMATVTLSEVIEPMAPVDYEI